MELPVDCASMDSAEYGTAILLPSHKQGQAQEEGLGEDKVNFQNRAKLNNVGSYQCSNGAQRDGQLL